MPNKENIKTMQPEPEKAPENGKIRVRLICPLYKVAEMEADSVLLPAEEGDILLLPERAPIFFNLKPGRMIVYNKGEKPISFLVSSGICEFRRNLCPVLAWGGYEDKIDASKIAKQLKNAESVLAGYRSEIGKHEVISRIDFFKTILKELDYKEETAEEKK